MKRWTIGKGTLAIRQGDLTRADTEAIVNAANSKLAGGGGVDGAIHRAAGPELLAACQEIVRRQGHLPPGKAVITPGFGLKASFVIHAVGPIWRGGAENEAEVLADVYSESLTLAQANGLKSISFPAISCGAYGYPVDQAAPTALSVLARGLERGLVREARMVLFGEEMYRVWIVAAEAAFGPGLK